MSIKSFEDHDSASGLLTIEEVLTYLKVKSRTIYRLISTGSLPAVRVGRQWRIRRRDLDAWLDSQAAASGRQADM